MANTQTDLRPLSASVALPDREAEAVGEGRLPTFFIIGAARSGTTSLHYVLDQHPQIYMCPTKETNFFAYLCSGGQAPHCTRLENVTNVEKRSVKTMDAYRQLFRGAAGATAIGETSPSYLLTPGVAETIRHFVPEAKIIAVLRQPMDKAYSHFMRRVGGGIYAPDTDFAEALELDEVRIAKEGRGVSFIGQAHYYDYLKPYYDAFPRERIKICFFEDLGERAAEFYSDLFRFLGVDPSFRSPDAMTKFNQSGRKKQSALLRLTGLGRSMEGHLRRNLPPSIVTRLSRWRHRLQSEKIERAPGIPASVRRELTQRYCGEDIAKLQELTGLDLSRWLR